MTNMCRFFLHKSKGHVNNPSTDRWPMHYPGPKEDDSSDNAKQDDLEITFDESETLDGEPLKKRFRSAECSLEDTFDTLRVAAVKQDQVDLGNGISSYCASKEFGTYGQVPHKQQEQENLHSIVDDIDFEFDAYVDQVLLFYI